MPKLDIFHNTVKRALENDNWTITHDPFVMKVGERKLYVDIGAARLISATKGHEKIVVEIKSFIGKSEVNDLEGAIGQFFLYHKILKQREPSRLLYLAVTETTFNGIFTEEIGQIVLADPMFRLIVFDEEKEEITQWIPA